MCGILGIISRKGGIVSLSDAQVLQMRDTMRQRGPDAAGFERISPQAVLAHRRLAIRDPQHGSQPWLSADGRWSLVYNGELYNTSELEQQTANQVSGPPQTRCDTELLLKMLQCYGEKTPAFLRGMFAFGAYDKQQQRLILARDRFGIKPLYYAWCGEELVFASSVQAIRQHPRYVSRVNPRAVTHYLLTLRQHLPAARPDSPQETCWAGIYSLPPGYLLLMDGMNEMDGQGLQLQRYWTYPSQEASNSRPSSAGQDRQRHWETNLTHLQERLAEAVRIRLVSDVPVGMMLSGGVDSCLLGSFVREHLGTHFVAECGVGGTAALEETEARQAQQSADWLGCHFRTVSVSAEDYRATWTELIKQTGQPLATPSDGIIYQLARSLKQQVGVVLGGEGADELFCGYAAIHGFGWDYDRLTQGDSSPLSLANSLLEQYFQHSLLIPPAALKLLLRDDPGPALQEILTSYRQLLQPESLGPDAGLLAMKRLLHQVNLESLLLRLDQATMAASLEARVPYTDHYLVEQFWNLPADHCFRRSSPQPLTKTTAGLIGAGQLESKILLRALASRRLPTEIAQRQKQSFPTPIVHWLTTQPNWQSWTEQTLLDSPLLQELFHRQPLADLATHPQTAGMWLWPLLNLALWGEA